MRSKSGTACISRFMRASSPSLWRLWESLMRKLSARSAKRSMRSSRAFMEAVMPTS